MNISYPSSVRYNMALHQKMENVLNQVKSNILENLSREKTIQITVENGEALVAKNGCLASWTKPESTGRSPKDTVFVKRKENENLVDWDSPNCLSIDEKLFDELFNDALEFLKNKKQIFITDRVVGADSDYALPVKTITDSALTSVFVDNMFRPVPQDIEKSCFHNNPFTVIALPQDKLDRDKYYGKLRKAENGKTSDMIIAVDFERRIGLVIGSAYKGSVKKMLFTVMNFYLPFEGILPLHSSANEGKDGTTALFLGLSGTGKTTLSADPERALLGDDEHGWNENGIANFENGCYAKMININPEKEPEIYKAVMHEADYLKHGAIVENAMIYPDGIFDFDDERLTENSRASYPLDFLKNIKKSSKSGHPDTIVFLTADASGVLPPVAKLSEGEAMFWFLMGYTSKLAGTETGIVEPQPTFSRFFGQPFMPLKPDTYAKMLGEKMKKYKSNVYLVNTGWSGGKFGVGKRMDINWTRSIITAAINGELSKAEFIRDERFKLDVPKNITGVPEKILWAENTWEDNNEYKKIADKLAEDFQKYFNKVYRDKNLPEEVVNSCPESLK